jgi:hypothetical protein
MQAMISDPACGVAGAVEDGPEDQELFDEFVGPESFELKVEWTRGW